MKRKPDAQLALIVPDREPEKTELKSWALVELYGHTRIVGMMTVEPPEFPGMIRVDVPDLLKDSKVERKGFTRYIGKGAVYAVTPIDETAVRELLPQVDGRPHRPMSFTRGEDW